MECDNYYELTNRFNRIDRKLRAIDEKIDMVDAKLTQIAVLIEIMTNEGEDGWVELTPVEREMVVE